MQKLLSFRTVMEIAEGHLNIGDLNAALSVSRDDRQRTTSKVGIASVLHSRGTTRTPGC